MSDPWLIRTLVFDLDDTLYAERDYVLSGFEAAGRWLRETHAIEGFAAAAGVLFESGVRGTIFDAALQQLRCPPGAVAVSELVRVYREHAPKLALLPEAAACLAWARPRFSLALLTDGYAAVQQKKIASLGLASIIGCRIITDELGREFWKPHPAGFRRIMTQFPMSPDQFVYVADNPRKDFIAPRSLGWKTVQIRRPGGEHASYEPAPHEAADREIASLVELRSIISAPIQ